MEKVAVIYEVEHVKSTAPFKWHNGGVTVSTICNVNIKWELPDKGLTFRWNFIKDIMASGGLKMPPKRTAYVAGNAYEADLHSIQTIIPRCRQRYILEFIWKLRLVRWVEGECWNEIFTSTLRWNVLNVTGPNWKTDQVIGPGWIYSTCFRWMALHVNGWQPFKA